MKKMARAVGIHIAELTLWMARASGVLIAAKIMGLF